ncbi:CAAX farnesyltransferase subunit alpha [Intoshia linei]|uniref:Protein farnesyltransferase/geranylgeranyltransferase type-1 subunit alpha n=1 Tax=Intoshia linei TaxID=1819745 RepID=A0A177B537_9BILA|nr:CAAX farnesyltransferase subunit alpha [Intoshia linei]
MPANGTPGYTYYANRLEWKDVVPIKPPQEPCIVKINYGPQFLDALSYFRAIIVSGELSERALELTSTVLNFNPGNYTAWLYRQRLVRKLNIPSESDMDFNAIAIQKTAKNYQVWQYRTQLVEYADKKNIDIDKEFEFLDDILNQDSKNYHAWQYRQWVLTTFDKWGDEMDYVEKMLTIDFRNNSAWNQRYETIKRCLSFKSDDIVKRELEYCKAIIKMDINNESVWNYIVGVGTTYGRNLCSDVNSGMVAFVQDLYQNYDKYVDDAVINGFDIYKIDQYSDKEDFIPYVAHEKTNLVYFLLIHQSHYLDTLLKNDNVPDIDEKSNFIMATIASYVDILCDLDCVRSLYWGSKLSYTKNVIEKYKANK